MTLGDRRGKIQPFTDAKASGIVLVEAGHYDTECAFMGAMMKHLQKRSMMYNVI